MNTAAIELLTEDFQSDSIEEIAAQYDVDVEFRADGEIVKVSGRVEDTRAFFDHFPSLG